MQTTAGTQIANIVATITNEAITAGWAITEEEIAVVGKMALKSIMDNNAALYAAYEEEAFQTVSA